MLRNDKKRNVNAKTEFGRTSIKKSTTHTIEQAVQWLTSVALNIHTPKNINVDHRKSYESY